LYVPPHFSEDSLPALHDAIRSARLGTLVTNGPEGLEASHVPMLLDPEPAPFGMLSGHIARANPQWLKASPDAPALAIFMGPDAYITPAWYATKRQTGKVVPTWNYVAIHASGALRFIEDADWLLALVTRLTRSHEGKRAEPWAVSDAPPDFIRSQIKGIVGFELSIAKLEGKWKMSQNRPAEDRAGVVEGLAREGGPVEKAVAVLVSDADRK
jgi:transcriptional regulator